MMLPSLLFFDVSLPSSFFNSNGFKQKDLTAKGLDPKGFEQSFLTLSKKTSHSRPPPKIAHSSMTLAKRGIAFSVNYGRKSPCQTSSQDTKILLKIASKFYDAAAHLDTHLYPQNSPDVLHPTNKKMLPSAMIKPP